MSRNISFMLTTEQVLAREKNVTRRDGWLKVKEGDVLHGCRKCMGLRKGEKIELLAIIKVTSVSREPLSRVLLDPEYGEREVISEGFPNMSPSEFVDMFCRSHKNITPESLVTRIEFDYLPMPRDVASGLVARHVRKIGPYSYVEHTVARRLLGGKRFSQMAKDPIRNVGPISGTVYPWNVIDYLTAPARAQ